MTPAALEDVRPFWELPYLNARQAAIYCGYEPVRDPTIRHDKQLKAFYAWAASRGVHPLPGRSVWRRADLDAAMTRRPLVPSADLEAIRRLAQSDAADHRRRTRLALKRATEE
jgi:hypothetical protein